MSVPLGCGPILSFKSFSELVSQPVMHLPPACQLSSVLVSCYSAQFQGTVSCCAYIYVFRFTIRVRSCNKTCSFTSVLCSESLLQLCPSTAVHGDLTFFKGYKRLQKSILHMETCLTEVIESFVSDVVGLTVKLENLLILFDIIPNHVSNVPSFLFLGHWLLCDLLWSGSAELTAPLNGRQPPSLALRR